MTAHHVRREKAALFQWVQGPPGDRSSRKQPGAGMEATKDEPLAPIETERSARYRAAIAAGSGAT